MLRTRFFVVARGFACIALGGAWLFAIDGGCSSSSNAPSPATALCQNICDCQGCNVTQRQACEAGFNDSETLAADKGCTSQFDAYVSCVAAHEQCVGNQVDLAACAPQTMALTTCSGALPGTGGSTGGGTGGGSSINECQVLADALTKASMGNGCSTLAQAAMSYTAMEANCPSATDANLVNCYANCVASLTDCTNSTQLMNYSMCVSACGT
jgi:hypothetical protein